jgi:hypothetical protein
MPPGAEATAMTGIDSERLSKLAEALSILFYILMLLALVCAFAGSAGSGLLLLVLGSCAHVCRVGAEGAVNERLLRGGVSSDGQARAAAPAQRAQKSRPTLRGVASSPVAADLADLRARLAAKISASR